MQKVLLALANLRKEQVKSAGEGQPTSTTDDEDIIHENVSVPCFQKSLSQNWAWPQGTGLSSWQVRRARVYICGYVGWFCSHDLS